MAKRQEVRLRVSESAGISRENWPVTRGVPLPKGALGNLDSVGVEDADGRTVPAQFRVLSRWPEGSLKWVLSDFQADVPANGEAVYTFCYGGEKSGRFACGVGSDLGGGGADYGLYRAVAVRGEPATVFPGGIRGVGKDGGGRRFCA